MKEELPVNDAMKGLISRRLNASEPAGFALILMGVSSHVMLISPPNESKNYRTVSID
jgi:hypothetical protein